MFELQQIRLGWQRGTKGSLPLETEGPSNCLSSIWTPKTWSFYSLCFPCFSPSLISFCSASNSLHPSELREGWCVFTFWTQHKTEMNSFVCHRKKHLRNFSATKCISMVDFLKIHFCWSHSLIITHPVFLFPLRMSLVLVRMLDCSTGGACLHPWGGVVGRDDICICLRV